VLSQSPLQTLLTAASMVACINAIVGGVTVVLAVRSLLDASVPVAAVVLGLATLFLLYQIRRFHRATTVVPELFEGEGPGMPGWTERPEKQQG
jgi:hypothetical protein